MAKIKVIDCQHCGRLLGRVVLENEERIQIQLAVYRIEMPASPGHGSIEMVCPCGEKTDLKIEEIKEIPIQENRALTLFPADFGDTDQFADPASAHSYR